MGNFRRINLSILILSILGFVNAGYLSWGKLTQNNIKCHPSLGDCSSVNNSIYSEIYGIPVAYIGLIGYLLILMVMVITLKSANESAILTYALSGMTLFGVIFSGYLTYIELAVLFAVCFYCVVSALLMIAIFCLSLYKSMKLLRNQA